jgi:hypothetical protein
MLATDVLRAAATALRAPSGPSDIDPLLHQIAWGVDELALFLPDATAGAPRRDAGAGEAPAPRDGTDSNAAADPAAQDRTPAEQLGLVDQARMTVVARIGDAGFGEGRRLARTYGDLCGPLPLAGPAVAADTLADLLAARFPWMRQAVGAVRQDLCLQALAGRPWLRIRPMLLEGPPGCGKTAFARTLSQLAGVGLRTLDAGGASDNRLLAGTARGWSSAQPALPLLAIHAAGMANPVVLVDELDKARASHNGDTCASLLGMLEPDTARRWFDTCLIAACDLSQISWIVAVNDGDRLPGTLRNRLRRVPVGRPTGTHAKTALAGFGADLRADLAWPPGHDLPVAPEAWRLLTRHLTRTGDLRGARAALRAAVAQASAAARPLQ